MNAFVEYILPLMILLTMFGLVLVVAAIRDAVAEERARRRIATGVAIATARLRRIEHEAMRNIHSVATDIVDVDGEEAS